MVNCEDDTETIYLFDAGLTGVKWPPVLKMLLAHSLKMAAH